jgi:hypothetical protein
LEKLKYLLAREVSIFGAPKFECNYGYIVAAIAQHFGMNFDDVAAERA